MPADHPDYIRAIRQLSRTPLGRKYNRMARSRYGISGRRLAAKELKGESNFQMGAVSSAGARGATQFMPATRDEYKQRFGVDAWAGPKSAVKAMELYQVAGHGIESYNPGDPNYRSYILGQHLSPGDRRALRSGKSGRSAASGTRANRGSFRLQRPSSTTVGLTSSTIPGQSLATQRNALRDQLFLSGRPLTMRGLLDYKMGVDSLKDVPAQTTYGLDVKHHGGGTLKVPTQGRRVRATSPTPTRGRVIVAANANRAGVGLHHGVLAFVRGLSGRAGKPITIGTGTNHNQFVIGTRNQSDHWTGHAADIPASGTALTHLGQQALIVAGMSPAKARQQRGGVYNLVKNGHRIQIIFNSNVGGNHYNHLHVGYRPA